MEQGCTVLTCARDVGPLADLLEASGGGGGDGRGSGRCIAIEADVSTAAGREALVTEVCYLPRATTAATAAMATMTTLATTATMANYHDYTFCARRSAASVRVGSVTDLHSNLEPTALQIG
eukprot:scaffold47323_cov48-Phaeocystis_antarctica.AAC.6